MSYAARHPYLWSSLLASFVMFFVSQLVDPSYLKEYIIIESLLGAFAFGVILYLCLQERRFVMRRLASRLRGDRWLWNDLYP